jgi:hypothetical protein
MAKKRFFRLPFLLVILFALTALSLISHYVADAVHTSKETCWSCGIQEMGASHQAGENAHALDLHGRFLLNELSALGLIPERMILGDMDITLGMAWIPPTPVRPPITL